MKALFAGALVALFCCPAFAQDASPSCDTLDHVVGVLNQAHEKYVVVDPKSLIGSDVVGIKGVLFASFGGYMVLGFITADGCVSAPTPLGQLATPDGKPKLQGSGLEIGT